MKLLLSYPKIRRPSKFGLASICSELAELRRVIRGWRPQSPPPASESNASKTKLLAEIAAAKIAHAEFAAKEEAKKPEWDRKQAEYAAAKREKEREWRRAHGAEQMRRWRKNNPEKAKAAYDRDYQRVKERMAADPEWAKEVFNKWRRANPERVAKRVREWRAANPEKVRAAEKRRRLKNKAKKQIEASTDLLQMEESKCVD